MTCDRHWEFPFQSFKVGSVGDFFADKTSWMFVADGAEVSATIRVSGLQGNFRLYLAWQPAATRPTDVSSVQTIGSAITTDSTTVVTGTLSANSSHWGRFGYLIDLSSGSVEGHAFVSMDLAFHQCAKLIGSTSVYVPPNLAATDATPDPDDALVIPVSDFVPAISSPKVKAAVIARNLVNYGSVRTQLVYRVAADRAAPGAWQFGTLESWQAPASAQDERNTGELTPTVTGAQWLQVGFAVIRVNGGNKIRGDFDVITGLIR